MMHLRDIDKTLGAGALRMLSKLGYNEEQDREVINYFHELSK